MTGMRTAVETPDERRRRYPEVTAEGPTVLAAQRTASRTFVQPVGQALGEEP